MRRNQMNEVRCPLCNAAEAVPGHKIAQWNAKNPAGGWYRWTRCLYCFNRSRASSVPGKNIFNYPELIIPVSGGRSRA